MNFVFLFLWKGHLFHIFIRLFTSQDQFCFFIFSNYKCFLCMEGIRILQLCLNENKLRHYSFSMLNLYILMSIQYLDAIYFHFWFTLYILEIWIKQANSNRWIQYFGIGIMSHMMTKTYVIYPFECLFFLLFWCNVFMPRLCLGEVWLSTEIYVSYFSNKKWILHRHWVPVSNINIQKHFFWPWLFHVPKHP